jgi:lipoate-protein ligase B
VWVGAGSRKIASLGIAVKKWVSYHGIALNIDCDLNKFQALKPCGFSSDVMTSVKNEMSEHYKQEWVQVIGRLKKDVILRLIENLREHLEVQHAELNHV